MAKKKNRDWFDMYSEAISYGREAAELLQTMICDGNCDQFGDIAAQIKEWEHKGDVCLHDFFSQLQHAFITPLDMDIMGDMMRSIDDINDHIEDAANAFSMYEVKQVKPYAVKLAQTAEECVAMLVETVAEFKHYKNSKTLAQLTIEVNRIEEVGDRLHREAIHDLFVNETDPIEVIRWKDIYNILEYIMDACEDVADCIQNILLTKD